MIYLAPLQTYTNLLYINTFFKHIGGIEAYFTPFYRVNKEGNFSFEDELQANDVLPLIPQVIANNPADLQKFAHEMQQRNFTQINLNMGCPFPMVVNKNMGSGLLPHPDLLNEILEAYFAKHADLHLSIKLRLGKEDKHEFYPILETLQKYPISEIIIHPRIGKQQYKGHPDWDFFAQIIDDINIPIIGNGDIHSLENLEEMRNRFPQVKGWMLGRGLLSNPLMLEGCRKDDADWLKRMILFHQAFLQEIQLRNDVQKLHLLKAFWEYPLSDSNQGKRYFRKLKKTGVYENYQKWLNDLCKNYSFT